MAESGDAAGNEGPGMSGRSEPAEVAPPQTGSASPPGTPPPASPQPAWSTVWPPWTYWVRTTLAVVATLLVVAAARRISHVLLLALVAFVLAVGLDPAIQWLGKLRIRRGWAVAIIFVGLVVFVALFVALLIPVLTREVPQFAGALPGYVADLQRRDDWLGDAFRHANVSVEVRQFIADLPSKIGHSFTAIVGAAGTAFGRVFDVFTVGILCIYFMVALPRLPAMIATLVSRDRRAQVDMLLRRSFDKIGGYVSGNLITSAVCGAATVVALLALRIDYALPLGLWAGVADLIPQVGAYLGALPAVLVALTQGPVHGAATVLFFIAYQQFENYVLAPRCTRARSTFPPRPSSSAPLPAGSWPDSPARCSPCRLPPPSRSLPSTSSSPADPTHHPTTRPRPARPPRTATDPAALSVRPLTAEAGGTTSIRCRTRRPRPPKPRAPWPSAGGSRSGSGPARRRRRAPRRAPPVSTRGRRGPAWPALARSRRGHPPRIA
jgi:predicted PurR-regulated permease PerM